MLKLNPLDEKFKSFVGETKVIDGHNYDDLRSVFSSQSPQVVIANTTKGKGVSYMEGKWKYHTIVPKDKDLIKQGMEELS